MSDDHDITDLTEVRARRAREAEAQGTGGVYAKAVSPDEIELWIKTSGFDMPVLVCSPTAARALSRVLNRAITGAWKLSQDRCSVCNKHACREWHPGRRYRGWRRGEQVLAICEKVCQRSVRLRVLRTGEVFYTRSYVGSTWSPCDSGVLGAV